VLGDDAFFIRQAAAHFSCSTRRIIVYNIHMKVLKLNIYTQRNEYKIARLTQ